MNIAKLFIFLALIVCVYAMDIEANEFDYADEPAFIEVEDFEELEDNEEDFHAIEDHAPVAPAVAPAAPAAPVANTTATPVVIPAGVPLVVAPASNATFPLVPNPSAPCGCYNNGECLKDVCICSPSFTGKWCERPSDLYSARQDQLKKLQQLADTTESMSKKILQLDAITGNKQSVQTLIAESARAEVARMNLEHATGLFTQAIGRNDLFTARNQLNLIKFMNAERYMKLKVDYHAAEKRINDQFNPKAATINNFTVPVMHEYAYEKIDVGKAKNLNLKNFITAKEIFDKSVEQSVQFNLDFGEPV